MTSVSAPTARVHPSPPHPLRGWLLQLLRVSLFAAIVWLIHDAQRRSQSFADAADAVPVVDVWTLRDWFGPTATQEEGGGRILDDDGGIIGRVLQTAPDSDGVIGFSGPTNVLLGFDADGELVGWRILFSGDTREHIAQVRKDRAYHRSLLGRSADELAAASGIDAVSGATLTSLAIVEGIRRRLGGGLGSLKFPDKPTVEQITPLFADAASIEQDETDPAWWNVLDSAGEPIGSLLRTSPAADNIVGYQGPTETLVGFDQQGAIIGFVVGHSYDNEPYVGYIRDDRWYNNSFNGKSLEELASLDFEEELVEGVSGATMTSLAIAEGMVAAAAARNDVRAASAGDRENPQTDVWGSPLAAISLRNWGTIAVTIAGVIIGLTRLRGRRWVRVPFQMVLIGYLGFVNGDLISQAMLVGWAQHGVPWRSMLGVLVLSVAAFSVPIVARQNVYCHQLCPHGAAQQWLRPGRSRRVRVPRRLDRVLSGVPSGLLLVVVATAMGAVPLSLVDIEPFDAYLITIAGAATITIAVVGLVASAFVPMAYCRYGCPTGAAIEYLRRHARSDRLHPGDVVAAAAVVLGWLLR
jgi:NosR/NirI family transcriptional regulator, nitrous oxide reductase regulator